MLEQIGKKEEESILKKADIDVQKKQ